EDTDTPEHAEALVDRLAGRRATINLIPYNPSRDLPYARPRTEAVNGFQAYLQDAGLVAPIRWSRGLQESAACGQLRAQAQ
ncbi:MAG: 23S rRNA (adenine(2503)-C(2))-methyltransferase RlmN, partial [Planctomycetes bacterium]|nr:23S rRNA (adenine(2503)-C(2))-methyltransferase RlmN [Planctomycetota bacterium]